MNFVLQSLCFFIFMRDGERYAYLRHDHVGLDFPLGLCFLFIQYRNMTVADGQTNEIRSTIPVLFYVFVFIRVFRGPSFSGSRATPLDSVVC